MRAILKLLFLSLIILFWSSASSDFLGFQKVSFESSLPAFSEDQTSTIPVFYESENNLPATGIGFTVHFDSSQVQLNSIDNLFRQSKVGVQVLPDDEDLDLNPDTDSYITAGWANMNGGWPDVVIQPIKLFDLNVTTTAEFETSDLVIRITSSDVNFNGIGDSITLSNGQMDDEPSRKLLSRGFDQE